MTPQNRTETLAHLVTLLTFAIDADRYGSKWALLAWVEKIDQVASELADEVLDELRQEIEHERATSSGS